MFRDVRARVALLHPSLRGDQRGGSLVSKPRSTALSARHVIIDQIPISVTARYDLTDRSADSGGSLHRADPVGCVLKRVLSIADTTNASNTFVLHQTLIAIAARGLFESRSVSAHFLSKLRIYRDRPLDNLSRSIKLQL